MKTLQDTINAIEATVTPLAHSLLEANKDGNSRAKLLLSKIVRNIGEALADLDTIKK